MDRNPFLDSLKGFFNSRNPFLDKLASSAGSFMNNVMNDVRGVNAENSAYSHNLDLQHDAQQFNADEAQKDRDWQKMMSDTAIQRQMADLEAAGLNPWLALNGGINGASSGSGAVASSSANGISQRNNQLPGLFKSLISSGLSAVNGNISLAGRVISAAAVIMAAL